MRAGVPGSPHFRRMRSLRPCDCRPHARRPADARRPHSGARNRVRTRLLRYIFVYNEGRPSHSFTRSGMVLHRRRRREAGRFRRHGARGGSFGIERRGARGERYLAKRGKRHILRRLVQRDVRAFSAERGLCRAVLFSRHRCHVIAWSDRTTGQFSLSVAFSQTFGNRRLRCSTVKEIRMRSARCSSADIGSSCEKPICTQHARPWVWPISSQFQELTSPSRAG